MFIYLLLLLVNIYQVIFVNIFLYNCYFFIMNICNNSWKLYSSYKYAGLKLKGGNKLENDGLHGKTLHLE